MPDCDLRLLVTLGLILAICNSISALEINETLTVAPGTSYMVQVCGTTDTSLTGTLCSQSQMYYSIQSNISIDIYWMNTTETLKTRATRVYDSQYSCLNAQSCVQGWFTASDPDKSLVFSTPLNSGAVITAYGQIQNLSMETLDTNVTIGPGGAIYQYVCGTSTPSVSGRSCSQTQIYYSVQASETANVYLMDLSDFRLYQKTGLPIYYTAYSAKKIYSLTLDWFTLSNPDKVLVITNPNWVTPTVVISEVRIRKTTGSALAGWAIAVIVISIVIAMVCGAVGLAFRCSWWCWRGATQTATQEKYGNLDGRGVYPVNVQMLPVGPGASVV